MQKLFRDDKMMVQLFTRWEDDGNKNFFLKRYNFLKVKWHTFSPTQSVLKTVIVF